jgi:hypothetical protein
VQRRDGAAAAESEGIGSTTRRRRGRRDHEDAALDEAAPNLHEDPTGITLARLGERFRRERDVESRREGCEVGELASPELDAWSSVELFRSGHSQRSGIDRHDTTVVGGKELERHGASAAEVGNRLLPASGDLEQDLAEQLFR